MKLQEIFREFISVVQENPSFNIGLLLEDGTVADCSDTEKIGTKKEVEKFSKTDVYYEIIVSKKRAGYLWVYSEDENLKLVSALLLDSLETRISAEISDDILRKHMTKDDELVKYLLDESGFNTEKIVRLIDELGINSKTSRVAIYLRFEKSLGERFDNLLFSLKIQNKSDDLIVSVLDTKTVLFFKSIPEKYEGALFKSYMQTYIDSLMKLGFSSCYFSVGSLQTRLKNYATSFKHSQWIYQNRPPDKDGVAFFSDFTLEYFTSFFPLGEVSQVYDYYEERGKNIDKAELINIAKALVEADFNLSKAATVLFLHKNTLIYKIEKYEKIFGIDIRRSFQGKCIFALIAKLYRDEKRKKRVGIES